jgi:hypothetical protein
MGRGHRRRATRRFRRHDRAADHALAATRRFGGTSDRAS